jgi:uncharacterized protein YhjY with autotransporter beta-barrel domain
MYDAWMIEHRYIGPVRRHKWNLTQVEAYINDTVRALDQHFQGQDGSASASLKYYHHALQLAKLSPHICIHFNNELNARIENYL